MNILLLGSQGQVGWELSRSLLPLGNIISTDRSRLDLSDHNQLHQFIAKTNADVIVNAAAYTAVDKAETENEAASDINCSVPKILADCAKENNALLIHYSTDYVFNGAKDIPFTEDDQPDPVNAYGRSKLAGEQAVQEVGGDFLIFRTSWVYAARGQNFLKTIRKLAAEREKVSIVADQIGAPTWARLIAETTAHCIHQSMLERKQNLFESGLYHLTSRGKTSWYGFAEAIVRRLREHGEIPVKLKQILPIPTTEYPLPAPRPMNSRLDSSKLEQHFDLTLPDWELALMLCMEEIIT